MADTYLPPRYYSRFPYWLLGHILKNKYYFVASYILLIFTTAITVTIPIILRFFFDEAIFETPETIFLTASAFLGLYIVNFFLQVLSSASSSVLSEYTVRNVQQEFFLALHQKNM